MGFWKITMLYKCCFWVRHAFGNYLSKLYFPKNYCVVTLIYIYTYIYIIVYENASYLVLHLGEYMNCWYGKMSFFYLIFDKEILDVMVY